MFKKQHLALAIAATLAAGSAQAALETSVTLKNETAYMTSDSIRTGEATTRTDTTGEGKGVYKFENTAKIYLNDELANGASWHGELNIVRDTKAVNDYQGHEKNTQRDWLRELYVDTTVGDWDVRLGKQQVVWGTADGIKLLDMINPTDWSEFNQNTMADSRIPVWMVNGEKYLENGDNIQLILSESQANKIAGLNASGDQGHPFLMKGVDSISGKVNGFFNIAPALGKVAAFFGSAASGGANNEYSGGLVNYTGATVDEFATNALDAGDFRALGAVGCLASLGDNSSNQTSARCLYTTANSTSAPTNFTSDVMGSNSDVTNLIDADSTKASAYGSSASAGWDTSNPDSMFEYMGDTSFATFTDFVFMTSEYRVKHDSGQNVGFRYKLTTDNGTNVSFNAASKIDSNPYVNVHWEDTSGNQLSPRYNSGSGGGVTNSADIATYITLYDDTNSSQFTPSTSKQAKLVFTEKTKRISILGGSFDTTIDTGDNPIVLRGEAIYEKGVMTPIIDRARLSIGDVTGALTTQEGDFFKYVIGADVTVLSDMMLSGQFIQFRNLDYVDTTHTPTDSQGTASLVSGARYTGDMSTLHLSNGLQKAEKNKEFYSLFLSKPFGESGEGRWNNIFMFEEGGGKWNRFDVEYGINDQLIGTLEYNKYFGDENTMFGQFENASNIQIGVKYLLQ